MRVSKEARRGQAPADVSPGGDKVGEGGTRKGPGRGPEKSGGVGNEGGRWSEPEVPCWECRGFPAQVLGLGGLTPGLARPPWAAARSRRPKKPPGRPGPRRLPTCAERAAIAVPRLASRAALLDPSRAARPAVPARPPQPPHGTAAATGSAAAISRADRSRCPAPEAQSANSPPPGAMAPPTVQE